VAPVTAVPEQDIAPAALELRDIEAGYEQTTVLRGIYLTVQAGSVTALIGPNGAGKTTLLKTASGLLRPTKGSVVLSGRDVTRLRPSQRAALGVCHIPEGRGIFKGLTVKENLAMQSLAGTEKETLERAAEVFPVLGKRLNQLAGTLSGGEQQMLSMARAYVRDQDVILVDEPSLGLAPIIVDDIFSFLERTVTERKVSLLVVDQFVSRVLEMAQMVYVLRHGDIAMSGPARDFHDLDIFGEYIGK
jgi:branched-chain amino acid transport system ATP-binding protein